MESEFAVENCVRGIYHVYKNLWDASVGEELPCEWYAVAVIGCSEGAPSSAMYPGRYQLLARYFWPISCLLAISGRSAACSLFLAERYYSIMSAACLHES